MTQHFYHPRHDANKVLFLTPIQPGLPRLHKKTQTRKNLHSLLGLGLKFSLTPSLTNSWSQLRKSSYDRLFRSVHLRFHFAGKLPSKGTTSYDPKLYVQSKWTPPHWTIPPPPPPLSHSRNVYHISPRLSTNCSKLVEAKQTFSTPTLSTTNAATTTTIPDRPLQ